MTVRKLFRKIHLWIGLGSGAIVFILGITGCILVFVDELKPLVYQQRLFVPSATGQPQPMTALLQTAEDAWGRSEEHTSELQSLMRISYDVYCLKKKTDK